MQQIAPKKRNHFISYLKGWAILSVLLIHLIDWSNIQLGTTGNWLKELLYPGVFFFMSTAGSVVYIAYIKSDTWSKPAVKLFKRGWQLIGVYYLYNFIKLFVYNFSVEPFYDQFTNNGQMNWHNILFLKAFSSPISILLTIGVMIMLSPILLYISKRFKQANVLIFLIIITVASLDYLFKFSGSISNFLFARNNIMFPIALWSLPFLLGYLIASLGFEQKKGWLLVIFSPITAGFIFYLLKNNLSLEPSHYMYPLHPYYMSVSILYMSIFFYLFFFLEKINSRLVKIKLATLRFFGDFTLSIYIYQWLVIDLFLWVFYPKVLSIWVAVPLMLMVFTIIKNKKFKEYLESQT